MQKNILLFVDDKPNTHFDFRDGIKVDAEFKDYNIIMKFDLSDAVEFIDKEKDNIACVIIDLHLPGDIPTCLQQYEPQYRGKIQLNEGQVLGMYLQEIPIDYFYLSSYQEKYVKKEFDKEYKTQCISKEEGYNEFKGCLFKSLKRTPSSYDDDHSI